MYKKKKGDKYDVYIVNKKALFDYIVIDEYQAGMVLQGTEVKSIRMRNVNLKDAYCYFQQNELWASGIHIGHYQGGGEANHLPTRPRKLLLHKRELQRLQKEKKGNNGLTIIVMAIFINERGKIKAKIALAKGKKQYDKRAAIKERDMAREMARVREYAK